MYACLPSGATARPWGLGTSTSTSATVIDFLLITAMRAGALTADIERVAYSKSLVGSIASSPGVTVSALATTWFDRSSLTTALSPTSETYQYDPSGSTTMWCGLGCAEKPSVVKSTTATTESVAASMTVTFPEAWLATYTRVGWADGLMGRWAAECADGPSAHPPIRPTAISTAIISVIMARAASDVSSE